MSATDAPGGPAAAPSCPRHPDRPSYVRCQRCERPTCPECQRPAAVGVQCVDCVAEQARTTRQHRTVLGAPVRADDRPYVTLTLIGLCVLSWLAQRVIGWDGWTSQLVFRPVLGDTEPYRALTAAFLHSESPFHILLNMYALWIVGPQLERVLGRARFAALYLVSAVAGSVAFLLLAAPGGDAWFTPVLGASGAVFGLFGAFAVISRRLDRRASGIYSLLAINLVIGFVLPNIAWQSHLGGLVVGAAIAAGFAYAPRERRRTWGVAVPALALGLVVGAAMLRYATAPSLVELVFR